LKIERHDRLSQVLKSCREHGLCAEEHRIAHFNIDPIHGFTSHQPPFPGSIAAGLTPAPSMPNRRSGTFSPASRRAEQDLVIVHKPVYDI